MLKHLTQMLMEIGCDEELTSAVVDLLNTEQEYKAMIQWLNEAKNPTREELLIMAIVIADEE